MTDWDWFESLRKASLDEVNFWQPSATGVGAPVGTPWIFKLHYPRNMIVGVGFFTYYTRMPISVAWETFTIANGASSLNQMISRVAHYRKAPTNDTAEIGCIVLSSTVFLEEHEWIKAPADWSPNVVNRKGYDLTAGPGQKLWLQLSERLRSAEHAISPLIPALAVGKPILVTPRLGQGAFRLQVTDAYGRRCAVTGERTLPALEAAHIKPFSEVKTHDVRNGLLLRSDLHRLFDLGYVSVQPNLKFRVSRAIRDNFENGRDYYALDNAEIRLPSDSAKAPAREFLEWHYDELFRG
ncbi:MAG: HNH endonuclease [Candidatus Velthaea sp.]